MIQRSVTEPAQRLADRAAAILVACVFLSLPTLSRLHDQLSSADNVAGFRLSKLIERPHERHGAPARLRFASSSVGLDTTATGEVIERVSWHPEPVIVSPASGRAPPAR